MNNLNKKNISIGDIFINRSSYVDPHGFLFEYNNSLYRAINKEIESLYSKLFQDGFLYNLIENFHLVETEISNLTISEANCNLVFKHKRIRPVSFCMEWPPSMLKQAALTTIQLNLALLEKKCFLQDAYPWNVLFEGISPVFVDLTSITPIQSQLIWPAYQQFINFFINPLVLFENKKGDIVRSLFFDYINGIPVHQMVNHLNLSYMLRHPLKTIISKVSNRIASRIQKNLKLKQKIQNKVKNIKVDDRLRKTFFKKLLKKIENINIRLSKTTWNNYYESIADSVEQKKKVEIVGKILDKLNPSTVIDIGCNTGRFSILAAQKGAFVTAIDSSEECIECLYLESVEKKHNILPLIIDILNPTPAFGFMSRQFPTFIKRCRSEVALCLGLMHHLHVNGRQPFERIAELMNALASKALIFEYIDYKDDNLDLLDHGRPINYSIQEVSQCLSRYFEVSVFDSDRPTRKMLLCLKK